MKRIAALILVLVTLTAVALPAGAAGYSRTYSYRIPRGYQLTLVSRNNYSLTLANRAQGRGSFQYLGRRRTANVRYDYHVTIATGGRTVSQFYLRYGQARKVYNFARNRNYIVRVRISNTRFMTSARYLLNTRVTTPPLLKVTVR